MAMVINITDLSGHTFTIRFKRYGYPPKFGIATEMKYNISCYYVDKLENDLLLESNLTNHDIENHYDEYFESDY